MTPLLVSVAAGVLSAQEAPRSKPDAAAASVGSYVRGSVRCKASQLIGSEITNTKNESLGEIQEIVFDSRNRQVAYAVVAFGGFLGMGEKYFALPWRLLEVNRPGVDEAPRVTLGLDHEVLKQAPGFDKDSWPDMANPTWAKQVDEYYVQRDEKPRQDGAEEPEGSGADGRRGADRDPGGKAFLQRRLSKLIGMAVVDGQERKLADVEDLIVDTRRATVDGALLSFGGILGMNEQLALVPAESLTLDREKNVYVFAAAKAGIDALVLPDGKCPPLHDDAWLTRTRGVCAKLEKSAAAAAAAGDVVVVDANARKVAPFADTYDLETVETVKGTIITIGSVRIGDASEERVRLRVRLADGREVIVYAAPATWKDQQRLHLSAGTEVEVTGSPVQHGTKTVLIAGAITVDGKTATLRDDEGHVTWVSN